MQVWHLLIEREQEHQAVATVVGVGASSQSWWAVASSDAAPDFPLQRTAQRARCLGAEVSALSFVAGVVLACSTDTRYTTAADHYADSPKAISCELQVSACP
jgi:hypothetical protein